MKKHMWVSLSYTPLVIEALDNGQLNIYADDTSTQVAEESAMIGCWFCHAPLTRAAFDTACIPEVTSENSHTEP